MIERELTVINQLGLHARAAAKLVQTAGKYGAKVELLHQGRRVNAKSIMGVMMLAAGKGSQITVIAEGDDALNALDGIEALVNDRFGEAQ